MSANSCVNPYLNEDAILYQIEVAPLPTFVLNSQIQGIIHMAHAAQVACSFLPADSVNYTITVMSYATGDVGSFSRAESDPSWISGVQARHPFRVSLRAR